MTSKKSLTPEQEKLIADHFEQRQDSDALLAESQQSPAVLKELAELTALDRLAKNHYAPSRSIAQSVMARIAQQPTDQPATTDQDRTTPRATVTPLPKATRRPIHWLATAAMLLLSIGLGLSLYIHNPNNIARVTNIAGTTAAAHQVQLRQTLSGKVSIDEGFRELTLSNGVILIIEAPAQLNIVSADRVILEQGKLVAKVPPNATGFRVDTPSSEIIDLGTVFGVAVDDAGESKLHVIQGEVKARANNKQDFELLTTNDARHYDQYQQASVIQSSPNDFVRALPGQSASQPNYLHWRFDDIQKGLVKDNGNQIHGRHYHAYDLSETTPIQLTEGKFGKAAILNGEGNWLETHFPGISQSNPRTVAFWVKTPSDFSTDHAYGIVSWGTQKNRSSWQISPNPEPTDGPLGRLRIGTYYGQIVGSTDLRDDQWHHVAIVLYGGDEADLSTHVLLYVDGKLEKTARKSIGHIQTNVQHPQSKALSIGRNIGYNAYDTDESQKYFKGVVDEMYVFDTALNHEQITALIKHNQLPKG